MNRGWFEVWRRAAGNLTLGAGLALLATACASRPADGDSRAGLRNFIRPPAELDGPSDARFRAGRALFAKRWTEEDGLGPLFEGRSCLVCHPRGGGGRPVIDGRTPAENASMIVRFPDEAGVYGRQLQRRAGGDSAGEGEVSVTYSERIFAFPDGDRAILRAPRYSFSRPAHGEFPAAYSAVIAPKLAGVGLLEAVPEAAIRALADPDDRDGDGISGRIATTGEGTLGRFGWKAESASVAEQIARAFALDMGLSTHLFPDPDADCATDDCRRAFGAASTPRVEVDETRFGDLLAFTLTIAEPPRGPRGKRARKGGMLFAKIGCAGCHHPSFETGAEASVPYLSRRRIRPYTDLLLHDLGDGLADGLSREWRTAPLWGVARRRAVQGDEYYLHDGRAGTILEAILWHGGEADRVVKAFVSLSREDRAALLAFVESL